MLFLAKLGLKCAIFSQICLILGNFREKFVMQCQEFCAKFAQNTSFLGNFWLFCAIFGQKVGILGEKTWGVGRNFSPKSGYFALF